MAFGIKFKKQKDAKKERFLRYYLFCNVKRIPEQRVLKSFLRIYFSFTRI